MQMKREHIGPILTNCRVTFSFQNSLINTIMITCSIMNTDFLNVEKEVLNKKIEFHATFFMRHSVSSISYQFVLKTGRESVVTWELYK